MFTALLMALAVSADAGTPARPQSGEAPRLVEARLKEAFAQCTGMRVQTAPVLQVSLPSPCRFADGLSAQGTLKFEFLALGAADAPTRERAQRFRVTAAPFTLGGIQFDGVLLEARLSEDARDMTMLPRGQKLKTRAISAGPGQGWVDSQPSADRPFDPIGDAARDLVRFATAAPAVAAGLGKELTRLLRDGSLQSAPELVALWALTASASAPDAG